MNLTPILLTPILRFDERGVKTGQGGILGHRQPKGPATRKAHLNYRVTPRLYFFAR